MPASLPRWLAFGIAAAAISMTPSVPADPGTRWHDSVPPPRALAYPGTIDLHVDARNTAQGIFSIEETLPVSPGPLLLLYPQWIPGNHSPTGPINKLAGLVITDAAGARLAWTRDPLNVYAFRVEVPAGVSALTLRFHYLSPTSGDQGRIVMTPDLLNLQWGAVVLYPAGHDSDQISVRARLTLPAGFEAATALRPGSRSGDSLAYDPVTLNVLQDSPVFAGRYLKRFDLAPGAKVPVMLNVFADNPRYLDAKPEQIEAHRRLVQQAYKLFGSQHYDHYDFLLSLSARMGGIGLEHHRSSENGVAPEYFTEWDTRAAGRDLLPHEFTHSWNGKFRRPADLATPNFNVPMQDSLLWVYEGQTQYWGNVLAARAGLWSPQQARDALALVAMTYTVNRPGFAWRNVQDTTNDPIIAQRKPQAFTSWQLSEDYYVAGQLIWLAVDARLRALSHGKRSLDDFARAFFGVDDGRWSVLTYAFDDVAATLEQVQPTGDWTAFLRTRLDANAAPLDGLAASGWQLVFDDTPNPYLKQVETLRKYDDFTAMLGVVIGRDGNLVAVRWDSVAFAAGLAVGDQVLAVDGRAYTAEDLRDAIRAAKGSKAPITLLIKDGAVYRSVALEYHDGLRYPHLQPIAGKPNLLDAIYAPRK